VFEGAIVLFVTTGNTTGCPTSITRIVLYCGLKDSLGGFYVVRSADFVFSLAVNIELSSITFFSNATTCPLWTSWSPLPVVAEV
jgi:hypothetical protein